MNVHRKLTPVSASRLTCIACCAGAYSEVRSCSNTKCPLWEYRRGRRPAKGKAIRTPQRAIREYHLFVNCGSYELAREPLGLPTDPWRLGTRPPVDQTYYDESDELIWFPWLRDERNAGMTRNPSRDRSEANRPPSRRVSTAKRKPRRDDDEQAS